MRNISKILTGVVLAVLLIIASFNSCEGVKPGHKGVEVSFGGKTNTSKVYDEGLNIGFHWIYDHMVEYDVREKTMVHVFEFNDKNNMQTKVELSLDYNLNPNKVNILHTEITDVETKIIKTLKSAGKEVVPQYSAVELNINKRTEAEQKLSKIMQTELPEFYVEFARVQMTDVDIPAQVAKLAEETAVQLGRNELAKKKEAEQIALAKAKVATAQGNYDAGLLDAKTKKLLSQPAILELKRLEVEMEWAKKGVSKYGNNNVFGSEVGILKGLK
ncbi:SPFH domain-containing protein [Tenacibaculum aiptasiae]|uniref:SPFH domain-containing protein n=1 Tax=Tenacibaculum aiptasiae TaxID=426481 RepID=UPI00232D4E5E|nr:SPFH domain-containing protein [Tenacibaculum aiptasiae]